MLWLYELRHPSFALLFHKSEMFTRPTLAYISLLLLGVGIESVLAAALGLPQNEPALNFLTMIHKGD